MDCMSDQTITTPKGLDFYFLYRQMKLIGELI